MSTSANPRHPNNPPSSVPHEPVGPVAADSLAAESIEVEGEFSKNPNAVPLGVDGANSTLNTTDTSGATTLPSAHDGTEREERNAKGLGSDEKGVSGVKYPEGAGQANFDGRHTAGGEYTGGPSGTKKSSSSSGGVAAGASDFGANTTSTTSSSADRNITSSSTSSSQQTGSSGPSAGAGIRPHVDAAPNYAGRVSGAICAPSESQPKGEHLVEGGDVPEGHGTHVGAVTGPNDPGRLGEQNFEKINAQVAGVGGIGGGKEGETEVGGQYGVLEGKKL